MKQLYLIAISLGISTSNFAQVTFTLYDTGNSSLPHNNVQRLDSHGSAVWCATNSPGNGAASFDGVNWTVYQSTADLPSDHVNDVFVDSGGEEWFATDAGLAHFDGTNWTTYTTSNSNIPGDAVSGVCEDGGGLIWVSTLNGVASFDGSIWTTYSTSDGLVSNLNLNIFSNGTEIWVASFGAGLSVFNGSTWTTITTADGLPHNDVRDVHFEGASVWVATYGGGLGEFNGTSWTYISTANSSIPTDDLLSVFIRGGELWVGTGGFDPGLAHLNGTTWEFYDYQNSSLPYGGIADMAEGGSSYFWAAVSGGGLAKVNLSSVGLESNNNLYLIAHPNPANDMISVSGNFGEAKTLNMYTLQGCLVKSTGIENNSQIIRIDVDDMVSGCYLLKTDTGARLSIVVN